MLSRFRHIGLCPRRLEPTARHWGHCLLATCFSVQVAFAAPDGPPASRASAEPAPASSHETALLAAINDYRAAQGLRRWRAEPGLAVIARDHSRAMARRVQLSHDGFAQRAARTGSNLCVENLLHGVVSPTQAVAAWLRSELHRANLLERDAAWAGVGIVGPFITLLACATPAPAAPAPQPP